MAATYGAHRLASLDRIKTHSFLSYYFDIIVFKIFEIPILLPIYKNVSEREGNNLFLTNCPSY